MNKIDLLKIIKEAKNNNFKNIDLSIKGIKEHLLDDDILEELKFFEDINLSRNMLKKLPLNFKHLIQVKKLNISSNYFLEFPHEVMHLHNLEFLDIGTNNISEINLDLTKLKKLKSFFLKDNPLNNIPNMIFNLSNLEELGLVNTKITFIPEKIKNLKKLKSLWVGKNKIKKIPKELIKLKSLRNITLDENPLPIEKNILEFNQNPEYIFDEYQKYENYKIEQSYESKITIIGESNAGKTSLLNRLIYNKFYENESKTENINIDNWIIHLNEKIINLNIWDFGGQDILYSLHKFFLTEKSIYIIVWDSRSENQSRKIEYWLNTIKSICKNPKVLIIANKIDEHNCSINRVFFDSFIPNIKYFNISCKKNWNIDEIKKYIKEILENNADLLLKFDNTTLEIKKYLTNLRRKKYITLKEYQSIVNKYNLDNNEKEELFKNLLNSGEILYYGDYDYRLKDKLILDVNWFTENLYMAINWVAKNRTNGSFNINDLEQIFAEKEFAYTHDFKLFFLDSLINFNILFEFGRNTFYFPNLLEYHNIKIKEIYTQDNYHSFKVAIKKIQQYIFYDLLVQIKKKYTIKEFYRNLITFNCNEVDIIIHNDNNGGMYIYIQKKEEKKIFDILELLLSDLKALFNVSELDISIFLNNHELVSIKYLKKLSEFGKDDYITQKGELYKISDILPHENNQKKETNIVLNFENINDVLVNSTKNQK